MEGEEFLTINPETFCDKNCWQYKDLQKLCAKLGLGGKGSRENLEEKLSDWHRMRNDYYEEDYQYAPQQPETHFPMNVHGNNFALMHIDVKVSKSAHKRRRSSIHKLDENHRAVVDPIMLRPICKEDNPTPRKSILKKVRTTSPMRVVIPESPSTVKLSKLQFSPFNGVKIISHRHELCISPFDLCD